MNQVKGIPYGISDFNRMRNDNFYFVDKTEYLPLIEKMPSYLFLIRPRRFGKSLFLSMMRTYYDILQQKNFDKYFGDLWIGKHPTDQRNRYQVLYFDFSKAGCSLPGSDMMSSFNEYCSIIINQFAHEYAPFYDADFKTLEMNYGYCDFFLLPNKQRYPDIKHSYILELKYATRNATDKELEAQAKEGRSQLYQYSEDKKVQELAEGTTLHRLLLQFRGWDMVKCEEV